MMAANFLKRSRRVTFSMAFPFGSGGTPVSRHGVPDTGFHWRSVVGYSKLLCFQFPANHHGVILVHRVVAVHRVAAGPIAEAHEDLHFLVGIQPDHVLAAALPCWGRRSVTAENAVLFEVNVHRVAPRTGVVLDRPDLRRVSLHVRVNTIGVEDAAVHRPTTAGALETEGTLRFHFSQVNFGRRTEARGNA